MRAWLLDDMTGIETLRLAEVPDPKPAVGEAVIAVEYAALNPADRYLAQNQYPAKPTFPHILGRDGVGSVIEIADGLLDFSIGDKVMLLRSDVGVNRPGTFAEKVAVRVESLARVPNGWSDTQAAGAALVYLTAYQALTQWGNLPASVVLVTGASGGVGVAAVQLATAAGHTVIALSRSAEKRDRLRKLGAAECLDPADPKWTDQLKANKHRVDLAIDNIGGGGFNELLGVMGHNGRISVVGRLAGPVPDFNTASLFFRRLKIGGVAVGDYTAQQSQAAWNDIVQILDGKHATPVIDSTFEFDQIGAAFERLHTGPMGKVLLHVQKPATESRHSR